MQAAIEQFARLGGFAALHQRDQKRVFDHFALRMAAANPHHLGGSRRQYLHTGPVVLLGESPRRTTDVRHDRTRRQPSARALMSRSAVRASKAVQFPVIAASLAMCTSMNELPARANRRSA